MALICHTREERDLSIPGRPAQGIAGRRIDSRGRCKALSAGTVLYARSGPKIARGRKDQGSLVPGTRSNASAFRAFQ